MPSNDFDQTRSGGPDAAAPSDQPANVGPANAGPVSTGPVSTGQGEASTGDVPVSIGGYRIEQEIGRGGMSHVFRAKAADQDLPVAIKVMDAAFAADSAMRQRFHREARAIQSLKHDHIVPLYAYGDHQGTPYLAMQLIDGVTLTKLIQYLRMESASGDEGADTLQGGDANVSTCVDETADGIALAAACFAAARTHDSIFKDLAELIATAAEAIDQAHQNGIVHRDLKPSNMMLDRNGQLWLTDFGLASIDEAHTVVTKTGEMIGTPHYMSPEQATADRKSIDYRTDIYSLGAALYELTTLTRPYQGDRFRVLMEIATGRLSPPSRVCPDIPKPLEAIILKAMEYSPADRYQSGAAMANDLRRFARGKAISARQPYLADHAVRWLVRNPRLSMASAATVAAVGFLIIAMMYFHSRSLEAVNAELGQLNDAAAEATRELANAYDDLARSRNQLRRYLYVADVERAYQAYALRDLDAVEPLLSRHIPQPKEGSNEVDSDLRGFEWRLLNNLCLPPDGYPVGQHLGPAREVAMVPGKAVCLTVGVDGMVRPWDLADRQPLPPHEVGNHLDAIAVSPDGTLYVTGQNDAGLTSPLTIRRVEDGQVVQRLKGHSHSIESIAFSPDGNLVATAERYHDVFLHSVDGTFLGRQNTGSRNESLAFSPDGKHLLACVRGADRAQTLMKYPVTELQPSEFSDQKPKKVCDAGFSVYVFAVSGNGKRILLANGDQLAVCRWPDGKRLLKQDELRGRVRCVAINYDGSKLYAGCDNGTLYIWELSDQLNPTELPLPLVISTGNQPVTSVQLTDDEQVVITTEAGSVQVWKVANQDELPIRLDKIVRTVAPGKPDSDELVVRLIDGEVAKLNLLSREFQVLQKVPSDSEKRVAVSPDGQFIVASAPGQLIAINADDGRIIAEIRIRIPDDPSDGLAFTSDGSRLIHLLNDRFQVFRVGPDETSWEQIDEIMLPGDGVRGLTISPKDNRIVIMASATSELLVFDGESYDLMDPIPCEFGSFTAVRFSDDGELLAVGYVDGTVEVLRASDFAQQALLRGHRFTVLDCLFLNDNRTLVTGSYDQIRFWDLSSKRELGVLASDYRVFHLHYSPSLDSLFSFLGDAPPVVWPTWREE